MNADENNLKNLLNNVPFDDSINDAHRERLKKAVIRAHMAPAGKPRKIWLNAAAIVFAAGLGLIISIQIMRDIEKPLHVTSLTVKSPVTKPVEQTQTAPPPLWSKDGWKKRMENMQISQRPTRRIIWISPTQKPTQGEQQ